jgi:hypothetical protein
MSNELGIGDFLSSAPLLPVTCHLSPITYHLSPVTFLLHSIYSAILDGFSYMISFEFFIAR